MARRSLGRRRRLLCNEVLPLPSHDYPAATRCLFHPIWLDGHNHCVGLRLVLASEERWELRAWSRVEPRRPPANRPAPRPGRRDRQRLQWPEADVLLVLPRFPPSIGGSLGGDSATICRLPSSSAWLRWDARYRRATPVLTTPCSPRAPLLASPPSPRQSHVRWGTTGVPHRTWRRSRSLPVYASRGARYAP